MTDVEDRCPVTELVRDQCAHCRRTTAPAAPSTAEDFGPVFEAEYGGRCADCGDAIEPSDPIARWAGGGYVHEGCIT